MEKEINRILVTGAGGPSGQYLIQTLKKEGYYILACDIDPYAAGLYLADEYFLVERGDHYNFVDDLILKLEEYKVDLLIPTVDQELLPLSKCRDRLSSELLLSTYESLENCIDKWVLIQKLLGVVALPHSAVYDESLDLSNWDFPVILKPRQGSGSTGFRILNTREELEEVHRDDTFLIQEYLPGQEYSVDVLGDQDGQVKASVIRERLKVDSGIAVCARTRRDEKLENLAKEAYQGVFLKGVANVQFKEDVRGEPRLLEINPRFPGTSIVTELAGVNMAKLLVEELQGKAIEELTPKEVTVVRYLESALVDNDVLKNMEGQL